MATTVNWKYGEDVLVFPAIVTEEAKEKFPLGVKEIKSCLSMTPQPNK